MGLAAFEYRLLLSRAVTPQKAKVEQQQEEVQEMATTRDETKKETPTPTVQISPEEILAHMDGIAKAYNTFRE